MTHDQITTALNGLRPGSQWVVRGDDYSGIEWLDKVQTIPTEAEIASYAPPLPPQTVLSQDLMAQFTATDAAAIQAAISGNVNFWLLWNALTTQKDPMLVTNQRFKNGWSALIQVLTQARMDAIAKAMGVTVILP